MRKLVARLSLLVARCSSLVLIAGAAVAALEGPTLPDSGRAALSAFLRESVARGDAPAVAAIVVDNDRVLFLDAAGQRDVANARPMTSDAIFRMASMTKPVTSLAAMMLIEQGKLQLDDPVTKFLPEFGKRQVLTAINLEDGTFQSHPPVRPVTVRDLLTNTSGVGYSFSDARLAKLDERKIPEREQPLLHEPGAKWTYGSSTAVVGQIIETITGQTLDVVYRDRIFVPLHMSDTFYVVPADRHSRVVTQHQKSNGQTKEIPNGPTLQSPARGDGGLFSTAADYGTFMRLFLNGGRLGDTRLLSAESVRLMFSNQIGALTVSPQPTAAPLLSRPFPLGAGKDKFGFGFQLETAPVTPGMRSAGSGSWGGIYNTHFWIDPQRSVAAAVLMQVLPFYDEACLNLLRGFERQLYQELK
jgi:methyl acetate hydrolase